jgi:hypothetical protein
MANAIIEILELQHLSPAEQESALKKIIADSYVQKLALERSVNEHIVASIASLRPIEKAALVKRAGFGQAVPQHSVQWFVELGSQSGRLHIRATCRHGKSWWDCHPDRLGDERHCNEPLPQSVRDEYSRRWAPPTDVGADMARMYQASQQPRPVTISELAERQRTRTEK